MKNTDTIISQYYSILSAPKLEELRNYFFHQEVSLKEKQELHEKYLPELKKLEKIFIELVNARNKIAQEKEFSNYFDFVTDWYGVNKTDFEYYQKNASTIAKKIINELPLPKDLPETYWTIYNEPTLGSFIKDTNQYSLDSLIPKASENRIIFKESKGRYFYADFDKKAKTATITGEKNITNAIDALKLAHEIGHAIAYLKLMDEDIDPDTKSDFWHEQQAIAQEMKYEATLKDEIKKANRDRILYHFVLASFEYEIYNNSQENFAATYAEVRQQFYPTNESSNPFYLLNTFLIDNPCYSPLYAVIYAQKLRV